VTVTERVNGRKNAIDAPHPETAGELVARGVCAWFGSRLVLEDVNLDMPKSQVTALIGPSGCGKSTFLRILNRMHEVVPTAQLAGSVELDGSNIYRVEQRANEVRRHIGMVFQRPNPFPAMSIYDNVLAGMRFTRTKVADRDGLVEESLSRAGLWNEVKSRLRDLGGDLSGGQQQRLCIARALAVKPKVLLMDEPCSALDPASTNRIEQTIDEIAEDVTVVIVTHNMQQAQRVSHTCAFFLAAENQPGRIIETGPTETVFGSPSDPRTADYVHGRFG
jgi:phosphate transport system ATP-binding protein